MFLEWAELKGSDFGISACCRLMLTRIYLQTIPDTNEYMLIWLLFRWFEVKGLCNERVENRYLAECLPVVEIFGPERAAPQLFCAA